MTIELLISKAEKLKRISNSSYTEYKGKEEILAALMNKVMENREDINFITGDNKAMMKNNNSNHVKFMSSIFKYFNAETLVTNILWVFRSYKSHGFTKQYWEVQIEEWINLNKLELSKPAFIEILPYYRWIADNIEVFDKLSSDQIMDNIQL